MIRAPGVSDPKSATADFIQQTASYVQDGTQTGTRSVRRRRRRRRRRCILGNEQLQ
jgi:hypothetical protein